MPETFTSRPPAKNLGDVLQQIKAELIEFAETRIRMAYAEFEETKQTAKSSIPAVLAAVAFFGAAFLLFTATLVSVIALAFGNAAYRWPLALLIVAILWSAGGALTAFWARSQLKREKFPKRTLEVLKADGLWLRDEVKSA